MKCLLCARNFQDKNLLKNDYIVRHKTDQDNWIFKALFEKDKDKDKFFVRKCYRCEEFLTSRPREKKVIKKVDNYR